MLSQRVYFHSLFYKKATFNIVCKNDITIFKHIILFMITISFVLQSGEKSPSLQQQKETPSLPKSTVILKDIVFKTAGSRSLALDFYFPDEPSQNLPLLVWIHGGAWFRGSQTRFLELNNHLVTRLLERGYAIASISYHLSQEACFPAQIQDCDDAITFLLKHSETHKLDKHRMTVMSRSSALFRTFGDEHLWVGIFVTGLILSP